MDVKPDPIPRVIMQHYPACIPQKFAEAAEEEGDEVGPGFIADSEVGLRDEADAEDGGGEGVEGEVGEVAVDCFGDGADGGDVDAVV